MGEISEMGEISKIGEISAEILCPIRPNYVMHDPLESPGCMKNPALCSWGWNSRDVEKIMARKK